MLFPLRYGPGSRTLLALETCPPMMFMFYLYLPETAIRPGKTNDANMAVKQGRTLTQLMGASFNLIDNVLKNTPLRIVSVLRQR